MRVTSRSAKTDSLHSAVGRQTGTNHRERGSNPTSESRKGCDNWGTLP
jgi:hypothetical protein